MSTNSGTKFTDPMDPTDEKEYIAEFANILESGETLTGTFSVTPTSRYSSLGVEVGNVFPTSRTDSDTSILFWPNVNSANQSDAIFNDDGVEAEFEITVNTTNFRKFQKTFIITVKQL